MMHRNIAGIALLVLSLGVAACGGAAPAPVAREEPPTPAPFQAGTSYKDAKEPGISDIGGIPPEDFTATPKYGGVVNAHGVNLSRIDPYFARTVNAERFIATLWATGLVRWDLKCNCPAPELAESWEISADGLTYNFKLRKGVKFHNRPPVNGREVTVEDIKWSMERATDLGLKNPAKIPNRRTYFLAVKEFQAVDPSTFRITMKQPDVNLLRNLMYEYLVVLPKEAEIGGDFEKTESLIGAGPFIPEIVQNTGLSRFKKNPDYYVQGKPYLDGITYLAGADAATIVAAYRSKQINWAVLSHQNAKPFFGDPAMRIYSTKGTVVGTGGYFMNMKVKPFDNIKVRQAFNLALDRWQMIDALVGSDGAYPYGFLGNWQPWHWSQDRIKTLPGFAQGAAKAPEIEQAKKLLAEAGFPNGLDVICECNPGAQTEIMLQQVKKAGFNVMLNQVSDNLNETREYMKDKQFTSTAAGAGHVPDYTLVANFLCESLSNMSQICDEEIERLYKAEIAEFDEPKRIELFNKIQQRLQDLMPLAFTHRGISYHLSYKDVRGWRNPAFDVGRGNGWDAINLWLDK